MRSRTGRRWCPREPCLPSDRSLRPHLTIQGEGPLAGAATLFVRFGGCDYRCEWCDSLYAVIPEQVRANAQRVTAARIDEELAQLDEAQCCEWVTLSGGNPALFELDVLVARLQERSMLVAVETQGSRWRDWLAAVNMLVVSPKPPSSGMVTAAHTADTDAFLRRAAHDQDTSRRALKIVVFDELDYEWARDLIHERNDQGENWQAFLSVGTDQPDPELAHLSLSRQQTIEQITDRYAWLCEFVTHDPHAAPVRVLPQLHVLAWGHARAV